MKFMKDRYMTRGIAENLEPALVLVLWQLITELVEEKEGQVDYLQVFDIIPDPNSVRGVVVEHHSEVPSYKAVHRLQVDNPIKAKIFVIDSEEYSTMMLSREY